MGGAQQTFLGGKVTLWPGDCLDVVKRLPAASVDSVVTDPPYALVSITKRFASSPETSSSFSLRQSLWTHGTRVHG